MKQTYNPDVLSCLANLSNDEVFTPPALANEILDLLPAELWSNPDARFLDPVCKSGVFLREIAKRLMNGLKEIIPDEQERANHIFKNQLFGIAITEITSFISRRSVYCSKTANGEFSVCTAFDNEQGNIHYERMQHTWKNGKCQYCGASQEVYDRDEILESHAYNFIHADVIAGEDPQSPNNIKITNMKFDVIIGNPPYQLSDGGGMGTSATPLYHRFIEQAKKSKPRYLTMIIPSRWFAGGKGLDEFRAEMLQDSSVRKIVDYFDSTECFPGVDISGGVCYFLWDRDNKGECDIKTVRAGEESSMIRPLLEKGSDSFVRFNEAISIVRKVASKNEKSFEDIVSPRKPFGFDTQIKIRENKFVNSAKMYSYPKNGYIAVSEVTRNVDWLNKHKVMIAKAYGERGSFPYLVLSKPFIAETNSCCSETYLVIGPFGSKKESENAMKYIQTRFFRFFALLKKNTQNAAKGVYSFVPMQDFNKEWTDEKLYKKYALTQEEIDFIESMIRPMDIGKEE